MPFLALVDEIELELTDETAVREAIRTGRACPGMWIKDANVEADWESVAERFPEIVAAIWPEARQ